MGFSRQEYWSGLPCPPPGDLPNPGIESRSHTWQVDSLPLSHQGGPCEAGRIQPGMEPVPPSVEVQSPNHWMSGSSVIQLCPTLCDPMDCSMPGFPVHHKLLELAQTYVLQVCDAIQPSHPLSPLLLPPIPPSIRVFSNESTLLMRWPKYWSFSFSISPSNEHPGLISFRTD